MSNVIVGNDGEMGGDVTESAEQMATTGHGVTLCYQTYGDPSDEPMLLVMGLGGPMTWWDPEFCRELGRRGFFVIRFDNRDTGRSSRGKGRVTRGMLMRAFSGRPVTPPYSLEDLALDAFALLDHLGIGSAHLVGVSMGGMIVQTMAIMEPDRVRSLTSIMSTTGRRSVGWQHPKLLPALLLRRNRTRQQYVAGANAIWKLIGSPGYPPDPAETTARARETWDRGFSAYGVLRQMMAIVTQPDRSAGLRSLTMPALVIHGLSDPMVHVSGARATAAAIPGAELLLVPGMAHDLPAPLYGTFADAIAATAARSRATS